MADLRENENVTNWNGVPTSNNTTVIVNGSASNWVWTAWFVLALISLFTSWIPWLWWLLWFLGLVLSFIGIFKKPRWLAIAWLVISLIDLIILWIIIGWLAAIFHS